MSQESKKLPLVSVPVITYNSSKTVLETLDSIYNQTYPNIELIVSDDCSTDDTVEICRQWINEHKERFVRTELLTVEKNTGVSGNCNRANMVCKGEWKKGIAGDDIMLSNCISDNMDFVVGHPNAELVFSKVLAFGDDQEMVDLYNRGEIFDYSFFQLSPYEQLRAFVFGNSHIPAPALFSKANIFEKYNVKNDERIPLVEDEPKWINLLKAGAKFDFIDVETIKYRVGQSGAISSDQDVCTPRRFDSFLRHYMYYKFPTQYDENSDLAVEKLINFVNQYYENAYNSDTLRIKNKKAYILGQKILYPIKQFKNLLRIK